MNRDVVHDSVAVYGDHHTPPGGVHEQDSSSVQLVLWSMKYVQKGNLRRYREGCAALTASLSLQ